MLVDDYCLLYPDVSDTFKNLPKVSSLFTCNFVTALTTIYPYTGRFTSLNVLKIVVQVSSLVVFILTCELFKKYLDCYVQVLLV